MTPLADGWFNPPTNQREDRLCALLREERAMRKALYQYLDHRGMLEDAVDWMHNTGLPVRFQ